MKGKARVEREAGERKMKAEQDGSWIEKDEKERGLFFWTNALDLTLPTHKTHCRP